MRRDGGFTLLEALVALAVLGAVMGAVYGVFSSGLKGLSRGDERLSLALIAESLLGRADVDLVRGGGEAGGTMADGVRWRVTKQAIDLAQVGENLTIVEPPVPSSRPDTDLLKTGEQARMFKDDPRADERAPSERGGAGPGNGGGTTGRPAAPVKIQAFVLRAEVESQRGETFALGRIAIERAPR